MNRAALYTRVSTKEQTEGLSLDNQRLRLTEWAKRENWEIVGDYQDAGFSGRTTNRPAFQQMLADAEQHKFDFLLARVRERLFRNSLDARVYADRFKQYGVTIRYLDEPDMEDTPSGYLSSSMLEMYAEYFSRDLSHKVRLGKQARLRSGRSLGLAPFGYNRDWTLSEQAPLAREMYSRYASGNWSALQLSDWLSRTLGRRFGVSSVQAILANPIYMGKVHNGEKGAHEPLVDELLWYQAREVAANRSPRPRSFSQNGQDHYVLSGIGRHDVCGARLWGSRTGNKTRIRRYACSDRRKGGTCTAPNPHADDIEQSLSDIIMQIHLPPDWQDAIRDYAQTEPGTDETAERRRLESKLARTRRAMLDDLVDYEEARRVIRETETALAQLAVPKAYEAAGETLTDLPALWGHMTLLERRNAAQGLLEAVDVDLVDARVVGLSPKPVFRPLFEAAGVSCA